MSQTFATLRTETLARGYDYLGNDSAGLTRVNQWINNAYQDICERQDWPFLETTISSQTPPVAFTDLRQILSVVDTTQQSALEGISRQELLNIYPDPATEGTPEFWYFEGDTVKVCPVSTDLIEVRYVKVPTNLSADGDTPLVPDRFAYVIVEGAVVFAQRDDDDYGPAQNVEATYEAMIAKMTQSLLTRNAQNPEAQVLRFAGNF